MCKKSKTDTEILSIKKLNDFENLKWSPWVIKSMIQIDKAGGITGVIKT